MRRGKRRACGVQACPVKKHRLAAEKLFVGEKGGPAEESIASARRCPQGEPVAHRKVDRLTAVETWVQSPVQRGFLHGHCATETGNLTMAETRVVRPRKGDHKLSRSLHGSVDGDTALHQNARREHGRLPYEDAERGGVLSVRGQDLAGVDTPPHNLLKVAGGPPRNPVPSLRCSTVVIVDAGEQGRIERHE